VQPSADIVVGLGWGDEGKGATVDALVAHSNADRVVRFNGGQQAAHNVIAKGIHHTFASYGSGTMSGVPTWISSYCTINPVNIFNEKSALIKKGFNPVLNVDGKALVTTALHVLVNVIREEARGKDNHGTTGNGFGETIDYSLRFPELALRAEDFKLGFSAVYPKMLALRDFYINDGMIIPDHPNLKDSKMQSLVWSMLPMFNHFNVVTTVDLFEELRHGHTVFEGAQGFVLDENFGFNPYTTWSTTTPSNARAILREAGVTDVHTTGCLRSYATRHGAGPLPHEGEIGFTPDEPHNTTESSMAGEFRIAPHDVETIQWAIDMTDVDSLAVGHLDVFDGFMTHDGLFPLDTFGKPIRLKAWGPAREDRMVM